MRKINTDVFTPKKGLHPRIWVNSKINSRIRLRLLDIADDFISTLPFKKIKPRDIILTGSLAGYTWTKYSDIDIHIIYDFDKIYTDKHLVKDYFENKRLLWNEQHNELTIYGFQVEIYVEDVDAPATEHSRYSLNKNKWLKEPSPITKNERINKNYITRETKKIIATIDQLEKELKKETDSYKIGVISQKAKSLLSRLRDERKEGIKKRGELCEENIIYKILRNMSYLKKLRDILNLSYDKKNSIEEGKIREDLIYYHGTIPHTELHDYSPPVKTIIAYKQFKLKLDKYTGENLTPGYVYPLYVNTEETLNGTLSDNRGLKIGVWYKAGEGECYLDTKNNRLYTKGKGYGADGQTLDRLAFRPGWHLTNTPWGNQRGANRVKDGKVGTGNNYKNTWDNEVWAKVEICIEKDMTDHVKKLSTNAGEQYLQHLGDGEGYQYRTNTNATQDQTWWIVDKIKIIEIMDDDSVDKTNNSFYAKLSHDTGRNINNNPQEYTRNSNDIPYWQMPRVNGKRYSKDDLRKMGYNG